jgi:hypothetical protein
MTERVVTETALLREPDFLKLWTGQAISHIGSSITSIGLPLVAVLMLHASPLEMGFLGGASAASVLLFGLFAGAWADRLRRRPILIAADLGRAVVIGSVPLAAVLHRLTMAHLCLVAAVGAMLTVLFDVSYQAYLPSLVESGKLARGRQQQTRAYRVFRGGRRARDHRYPDPGDYGADRHPFRYVLIPLFGDFRLADPQAGAASRAGTRARHGPRDPRRAARFLA